MSPFIWIPILGYPLDIFSKFEILLQPGPKVLSNVHVLGDTTVNKTNISTIILSQTDQQRDTTLADITRHLDTIDHSLGLANDSLRGVVTKSSPQTIHGSINFATNVNVTVFEVLGTQGFYF